MPELILDAAESLEQLGDMIDRRILRYPTILVPPEPFGECNWAYESYRWAEAALRAQGSAQATERQAYEWLQVNGFPGQGKYGLPTTFKKWVHQVRDGTPRPENPAMDQLFVGERMNECLFCIPFSFEHAIEKCQVDEKPAMAQALTAMRDQLLNACRHVQQANLELSESDVHQALFSLVHANIPSAVKKLRRLADGFKDAGVHPAAGAAPQLPASVTLEQFMRDYCEAAEYKDGVLESRKTCLFKGSLRKAIKLPKHVGKWKSGKPKYFRLQDLIERWPSYCEQFPNLPHLKSELLARQTGKSKEKSGKSRKGKRNR